MRRAQARLWGGDASGALALLDSVVVVPTDGRAALVRGRALASIGDSAAFASLVRAVVLDVDGSSEALSDALTHLPSDDETRARVTAVVDAKAEAALARWRAAFASARGEHAAASRASPRPSSPEKQPPPCRSSTQGCKTTIPSRSKQGSTRFPRAPKIRYWSTHVSSPKR